MRQGADVGAEAAGLAGAGEVVQEAEEGEADGGEHGEPAARERLDVDVGAERVDHGEGSLDREHGERYEDPDGGRQHVPAVVLPLEERRVERRRHRPPQQPRPRRRRRPRA